jgi:hypothetical protein
MKKVLLAAIVLMGTQAGFSQINKGNWLIGGDASFTSSKYGANKSTNLSIYPDAGYFFIDHLAGGVRAGFAVNNPSGSSASTQFSAAPFVRYYFLPSGQKVNIFADGEYGFGSNKSGGMSESFNEFTFAAGPAFFLSPSAALEFAVFYDSFGGKYYSGSSSDRYNSFGFKVGFQFHLACGSKK